MDKRMGEVVYFVEATSFEQYCLWKENQWAQDHFGFAVAIQSGPRPINVCFSFTKIHNQMIAFWEPISELVDYKKINKFFKKHFPKIPLTDANNFHTVLNHLEGNI